MKDKLAWQKRVNHMLIAIIDDLQKLDDRISALEKQSEASISVTTDKPRKHYSFTWCNKSAKKAKRGRISD